MSRIANAPITVPQGVEVKIEGRSVKIKGSKGELALSLYSDIELKYENDTVTVATQSEDSTTLAMAGTSRALLANMMTGVSQGFQRKLEINGVGYRAQLSGNKLNLALGFSHPVEYEIPEGITLETPSQTQIIVTGIDKQKVGQVAADIRAFRPPEPYKGKGVRYADEQIIRKEAKKV